MRKYLFMVLTCFPFYTQSFAQDSNDFEAELRLLEKSELEAEAKEMQALENSWIEDETSLKEASTVRGPIEKKTDFSPMEAIRPVQKARRVRSR